VHTRVALIFLCVLITAVAVPVLAVPNCSQVDTGFCIEEDEDCIPWIQWQGSCADTTRQWRCYWAWNPDCPNCPCYGPWTGCNCSGGGCDCLLAETPITMADGSTKPISKIQRGDLVLAYDELSGRLGPAEVVRVHEPYIVKQYLVINEEIRLTQNHPILSEGKWVAAGDLLVGDTMTLADGSKAEIYSILGFLDATEVYNIEVESGTYIANGVIVHNKEDCREYEQHCPGC